VSPKNYTTGEAARAVGISRATLQEWIARRKFIPPETTTVGGVFVRLWTKSDVSRLRAAKAKVYLKGRGRKKKKA